MSCLLVGVDVDVEFLLGFRLLMWRSTHFSIIKTESVLGSLRSANVLTVCDGVTRKVTAIPFSACGVKFTVMTADKSLQIL